MREIVERGFQSEEMRDAILFTANSLPEFKFEKMAEKRMTSCPILKKLVLCTVFKANSRPVV